MSRGLSLMECDYAGLASTVWANRTRLEKVPRLSIHDDRRTWDQQPAAIRANPGEGVAGSRIYQLV